MQRLGTVGRRRQYALAGAAVAAGFVAVWCLQHPGASTAGRSAPRPAEAARLPLAFVENRGQWRSPARYVARAGRLGAGLEPGSVLLALTGQDASGEPRGAAVRLAFEGASPDASLSAGKPLPGIYNFFLGRDPAAWRTRIPGFDRVRYENLYDGIAVHFRGAAAGGLEYDVELAPHADLRQVVVRVDGAESLAIDGDGALAIATAVGTIRQSAPQTWEMLPSGARRPVACRFRLLDEQRFGFEAPGRDEAASLMIDPVVGYTLAYATYLGSTGPEFIYATAADAAGHAHVAGSSDAGFPTTVGSFQPLSAGDNDVFVTKLSPDGSALVYSTFLGGEDGEGISSEGLVLGANGNAYLAGATQSTAFPTTPGAYQTANAGSSDAFVAVLSNDGASLLYSTYAGGPDPDGALCVDLGPQGNVYFAGYARAGFPTPGGYDPTYNGDGDADAFVAKLAPNGNGTADLLAGTFLGTDTNDRGLDVAVDSGGYAYVVGHTGPFHRGDPQWPTTPNALVESFNIKRNQFVSSQFLTKLTPDLSALAYSTMLGDEGALLNQAHSVAVDGSGCAFVAGETGDTEFPMSADAFDDKFGGFYIDGFVLVLDTLASGPASLVYGTYLGGSADDHAQGIAIDAARNLYVVGKTAELENSSGGNGKGKPKPSDPFPNTEGTAHHGNWDAFVTILARDNGANTWTLAYSNVFGGSDFDDARAVAIDGSLNVFVGGTTVSPDFPATPGAFDTTLNATGVADGTVLKLTPGL